MLTLSSRPRGNAVPMVVVTSALRQARRDEPLAVPVLSRRGPALRWSAAWSEFCDEDEKLPWATISMTVTAVVIAYFFFHGREEPRLAAPARQHLLPAVDKGQSSVIAAAKEKWRNGFSRRTQFVAQLEERTEATEGRLLPDPAEPEDG